MSIAEKPQFYSTGEIYPYYEEQEGENSSTISKQKKISVLTQETLLSQHPPPISNPTWFEKHKFRLLAASCFLGIGIIVSAVLAITTHCLKEKIIRESNRDNIIKISPSQEPPKKTPSYLRYSYLFSTALTRLISETVGPFFKLNYHTEMFEGCTLQANPCKEHGDLKRMKKRMEETGRPELVISLTEPHEYEKHWVISPYSREEFEEQGIAYRNYPTTDILPLKNNDFCSAVEEMRMVIINGGHVTVHCKAGVGRSASIVMAYLMAYGKDKNNLEPMTYQEALDHCTSLRKQVMNEKQVMAIKKWAEKFHELNDKDPSWEQRSLDQGCHSTCNQVEASKERQSQEQFIGLLPQKI